MTLSERFRYRLRIIRLALTLRPIAGGDETPEEKAEREKAEAEKAAADQKAAAEAAEKKPPWGSDEDFDPERAWSLIEKLRGETKTTKAERDELAKQVKAAEDADKTEAQKLTDAKADAEKRATTAEGTALRLDVALDKAPEGMSVAQVRKLAKRLSGSTREELEADAEELFAEFAPDEKDETSGRRPKERLRPGAAPSSEPEETNPEKLAAMVPRMN